MSSEQCLPMEIPELLLNKDGRDRVGLFYQKALQKLCDDRPDGNQGRQVYGVSYVLDGSTERQDYMLAMDSLVSPKQLQLLLKRYQEKHSKLLTGIDLHDYQFAVEWCREARETSLRTMVRHQRFIDESVVWYPVGRRVNTQSGKEYCRDTWLWTQGKRPTVSVHQPVIAEFCPRFEDLAWAAKNHLGLQPTTARDCWDAYISMDPDRLASPEIHDWNMQNMLWDKAESRTRK